MNKHALARAQTTNTNSRVFKSEEAAEESKSGFIWRLHASAVPQSYLEYIVLCSDWEGGTMGNQKLVETEQKLIISTFCKCVCQHCCV